MKTRSILGAIVGAVAAVFAITPSLATASTIDITYFTGSGCSGSATGGSSATLPSTTCSNGSGSTTVSGEANLDIIRLDLASTFTGLDSSHATIRIQDLITVTGGTGSGTIAFDWVFDGMLEARETYYSYSNFSNLGGFGFGRFIACGDSVNVPLVCANDLFGPLTPATDTTTVSNLTRSISIPFTFDVPFMVDWRLTALIADRCGEFSSCPALGTPRPGGGEVQFGDTLQLRPLTVRDAAGSQVNSAIVTSDSNVRYAVASGPGTVPEPSMLVLFSSGLLTAFGIRLRRK